jgi:hypothetical protein
MIYPAYLTRIGRDDEAQALLPCSAGTLADVWLGHSVTAPKRVEKSLALCRQECLRYIGRRAVRYAG